MTRNRVNPLWYQILVVFGMVIFASLGFVLAWALFNLQEPREAKRPGLNIKEF